MNVLGEEFLNVLKSMVPRAVLSSVSSDLEQKCGSRRLSIFC